MVKFYKITHPPLMEYLKKQLFWNFRKITLIDIFKILVYLSHNRCSYY